MAQRTGRNAKLIELNPDYIEIARKRLADDLEASKPEPLPLFDAAD